MLSKFTKEINEKIDYLLKKGIHQDLLEHVFVDDYGDILVKNTDWKSNSVGFFMLYNKGVLIEFGDESEHINNYDDLDIKLVLNIFKEDEILNNILYKYHNPNDKEAFMFMSNFSELFKLNNHLFLYRYVERKSDSDHISFFRVLHYEKKFDFFFYGSDFKNDELLLSSLKIFLENLLNIVITEDGFKLDSLPYYAELKKLTDY